jgi:MazG family protein
MKSRKDKRMPGSSRTAPRAASATKLPPGVWFEKLVAVQKRLRAPKGCPWDREQTHLTLRGYLIEEAYEVLEALESHDDKKFAEELGDLLLQITFHSQIASEERRFDISDVIREVHDKMVRRHPHVFGTRRAKDSAEVLRNWEKIKAQERQAKGQGKSSADANGKAPASLLDGVARTLPATLEALQLTKKASRIGFDWSDVSGVLDKVREEMAELQHALTTKDAGKTEEEMGDLLFAAVNLARFVKVDPEIALKKANAKFSRRFRQMERLATESGQALEDVPRPQMETLWGSTKSSDSQAVAPRGKR